jgi:hypothetical protein
VNDSIMAGTQDVTPFGFDWTSEALDTGTLALMPTPAPLTAGTTTVSRPVTRNGGPVDAPMSGGLPYAVGQASVVRVPVPGTNGLAIELRPRGRVPKGGTTSTLFIQDPTGRRQLRLDYGFNVKTNTIDYHWNQQRVFKEFGIADHTVAGNSGEALYGAAKYFRYAGRVLVVAGVALDTVSIAQASKPLKRASEVVAGWAAAWVGCKAVGAGGALLGTALSANPIGTAIGGIGGCIVGGIGGYYGGSIAAAEVYDWAEGTFFTPLEEVTEP